MDGQKTFKKKKILKMEQRSSEAAVYFTLNSPSNSSITSFKDFKILKTKMFLLTLSSGSWTIKKEGLPLDTRIRRLVPRAL
jgi:hypothetical protein